MNEEQYRKQAIIFIKTIKISRQLMSCHKPSIGYVGEVLLRKFVHSIIPKEYGVCTGLIRQNFSELEIQIDIDRSNNRNIPSNPNPPQCDIIVYKKSRHALEFKCGDIAIVNREFVHMVIEVKSSIGPKGFEKTLRDFELINTKRKILFIYQGPTVETIKKYFYNRRIDLKNKTSKKYNTNSVVIDNGVSSSDSKYDYDYSDLDNLPDIVVSFTPDKEFLLSKDYVIQDGDYMGYNSIIFEDSKHKQISCLQELACYIGMSFGNEKYTPDRSKISTFYAIPLFPM